MSDQVKETSRYARKQITVRGLMDGDYNADAKEIMASHGVLWSLGGSANLIEETVSEIKKTHIEIKDTDNELVQFELPPGLTDAETEWVKEVIETSGGSWITHTEERVVVPDLPYIQSPVRFFDDEEAWLPIVQTDEATTFRVDMTRCTKTLTITIEGKCKDDVVNDRVDELITESVSKIRKALKAAGFTETDLEIDCEVIMGAEREAKCDPNFMRSLLTDNNAEDEEE